MAACRRVLPDAAAETPAVLRCGGCLVGRMGDSSGLLWSRDDPAPRYRVPEEGGITGMGSIAIPWVVENVGQAHAFIEAMIQPETAGLVSAGTGTDSRAEGAVANTGEVYGDRFAEAHTAENPAEPWHCQAGTPYFAPVRLERADRIADAT